MSAKRMVIVLFLMLISYLHGGLTIKYRIFPYDQLESMKNFVVAQTNLTKPALFSRSDLYEYRISFFSEHGIEYDVVMIGDSLTERADWEDLFPHLNIANRGIGGDTTDGVLDRIDSICSTKAQKAFVMIGINDFSRGYSVNSVAANYKNILLRMKECGIKTYVQSTVAASKNKKNLNTKVVKLNELLPAISAEAGFDYIDITSGLTENGLLSDEYTRDGLHLNGSGYRVWRDIIKPYME